MITIEVAAKTVQKAIEEGLLKLNKTEDEVDIKVLNSGGFLKKAKIEMTVTEEEKPAKKEERPPLKQWEQFKMPDKRSEQKQEYKQQIPAAKNEQRQEQKNFEQKPKFKGRQEQKPFAQRQSEQKQQVSNVKLEQKAEQKPKFEQKQEKAEQSGWEKFESKPAPYKQPWQKQERTEEQTAQKPFAQKQDRKDEQKAYVQNRDDIDGLVPPPTPQYQQRQGYKQGGVTSRGESGANKDDKGYQPFRQRADRQSYDRPREKTDEHRQRPHAEITEEAAKEAAAFVENLLKKMDIEFKLTSQITDGDLKLNIECENGAIIGYRGETLDSVEYLASLALNKNDDKYYRISVDCNDYRTKRVETLAGLAGRMADKAVKTGRKVILEPMSSSSRKIIHSVLSANDRIITKSEGREPNRRIVIIPKRFR
ncbi:MAG: KH domain-containing protein [Firmicutes bacterium]|nr:KH domain-containing protein [Bacillota bacterium]